MTHQLDTLSPKQLLELASQGNKQAFGALYQVYFGEIYRYIYYRVYNHEEAEDLTEMVFLKTWEVLQQNQGNHKIENIRAWFYRAAHNRVIDHHRTKKDEQPIEYSIKADQPSLEAMISKEEESEYLAKLLKQLNPIQQQVIILRFINQMSHAETAEVLNKNEAHVRVLQYRALKKLRKIFEKEN